MLLLSSYSGGTIRGQEQFATSRLAPVLEEERDKPIALVFSSLYYSEKNFGYAVLDLDFGASLALYSILPQLNGSLMSLAQKCTIRAYADVLDNMSRHDPLTGLLNRRGYIGVAEELMDTACQTDSCFAMISIDMDGMKRINDLYGHQAGDQAIQRMGRALRVLEDEGMTVVHISGDEFLAVGVVAKHQDAIYLHDCLYRGIERINREQPWICPLSASIGVYVGVPLPDETPDDFMQRADKLMYAEKRAHKIQNR